MKKIAAFFATVLLLVACISTTCFAAGEVKNGAYDVAVTMTGGTNKVSIMSPAKLIVAGGKMKAKVVLSSKNYTYMKVNGVEYDNEQPGSNSTFTIPVSALDTPISVEAETVAMSEAHVIAYKLTFASSSLPSTALKDAETTKPSEQSKPVAQSSEAPSSSAVEASKQETNSAGIPVAVWIVLGAVVVVGVVAAIVVINNKKKNDETNQQ